MKSWVNMQCWHEHSHAKDSNALWKWQELLWNWLRTSAKPSPGPRMDFKSINHSFFIPDDFSFWLLPCRDHIDVSKHNSFFAVYNKLTEFLVHLNHSAGNTPLQLFFMYVGCFFIPHCPCQANPPTCWSWQEGRLISSIALWETYKMSSYLLVRQLS